MSIHKSSYSTFAYYNMWFITTVYIKTSAAGSVNKLLLHWVWQWAKPGWKNILTELLGYVIMYQLLQLCTTQFNTIHFSLQLCYIFRFLISSCCTKFIFIVYHFYMFQPWILAIFRQLQACFVYTACVATYIYVSTRLHA